MTDTTREAVDKAVGMCGVHGLHGTQALLRALLAAKEAAEADKTLLKAVLDGAEYNVDMEWLREHGTEGAHAVGAEAARITKTIIEALAALDQPKEGKDDD